MPQILLSTRVFVPSLSHPDGKWAQDLNKNYHVFCQMTVEHGYDGVSCFLTRAIKEWWENTYYGTPFEATLALEQPYMSEETWQRFLSTTAQRLRHGEFKGIAKLLASQVWIAGRRESMPTIYYILSLIKKDIPVVVYPHHKYPAVNLGGQLWNEGDYPGRDRIETQMVRPTKGLFAPDFWSIPQDRIDAFRQVMLGQGYHGISLHLSDWREAFGNHHIWATKVLAPYVWQVQVGDLSSTGLDKLRITLQLLNNSIKATQGKPWNGQIVVTRSYNASSGQEFIQGINLARALIVETLEGLH